MPDAESGGFLLSLLTESFAVRALVGSLAAAGLAAFAVRCRLVRSSRARRLLILTPVLVAATAAVASVGEAYLPQLWVATGNAAGTGQLLELLAELRVVSLRRDLDLLVVAYSLVVVVLLARRVVGLVTVRRLLRTAVPPGDDARELTATFHRLAAGMEMPSPRLRLLAACPGGAFTVGSRRPLVAVDPELATSLDERELEGLLAHELAHVNRRDPLLSLVVGVFRDLTFFLPPIHLAARWLRREQEESADELAATHTQRPAALASSILKVWDTGGRAREVHVSCAAAAGTTGAASRIVTTRVERLISFAPGVSSRRRRAELALAAAVLAGASTTGLLVPGWIATVHGTYSLSFGYLSLDQLPEASVESPAFATFRRLAPSEVASPPASSSLGLPPAAEATLCPCVETQSQLRRGLAATVPTPDERMLWHSPDHDPWRYVTTDRHGVAPARPLWTLTDSGPQVGFFLVGRPA